VHHQFAVTRKYDIPLPGIGSYAKPIVTQPDNIKQRFAPFGAGNPGVPHCVPYLVSVLFAFV
jgi:hypothetical protein